MSGKYKKIEYKVCVADLNNEEIFFKIKVFNILDEVVYHLVATKKLKYENLFGDFLDDNIKSFQKNEFFLEKIDEKDFFSIGLINKTVKLLKEYLSYGNTEEIFSLKFFENFRIFHKINLYYEIYEFDSNTYEFNINNNAKLAGLIPSKNKNKGYLYTCESIKEIIFSMLHSYIVNGYKLVMCEHCGKWFATKTFKRKYCNRNSIYENFEHLDCEQAVRNIRQSFGRKYTNRKKVLEYKRDCNKITEQELNDWICKANELKDNMKAKSNMKNIKKYEEFLNEKEK